MAKPTIRGRRAIGHSDDAIRAEHPEWWNGGKGSASQRMWHRDRQRARTA